jgi:hypothetical protein
VDESSVDELNDNLGIVNFILLSRIYDMLALIADGVGKGEDALRLIALHQSGELMAPPPSLAVDGDDNGDENEPTEENDQ